MLLSKRIGRLTHPLYRVADGLITGSRRRP